jgi:predicted membrane protein
MFRYLLLYVIFIKIIKSGVILIIVGLVLFFTGQQHTGTILLYVGGSFILLSCLVSILTCLFLCCCFAFCTSLLTAAMLINDEESQHILLTSDQKIDENEYENS